ncbi:DUF2956 domain-containing protein [Shewanella sp. A25]|nr:DUF2956 domain-containing protein [Shewanella shenzhenensis]
MKPTISAETQQDALAVAKSIQKPGQTKEQTKLIAQGIEKGIAEYKKQQKAKARERDKFRKQQLKSKAQASIAFEDEPSDEYDSAPSQFTTATWICLTLLLVSWLGFGLYLLR